MANVSEVKKFHNGIGASKISISSKTLMCIGAPPPLDHPHIYLNMGEKQEIICPYCSTRYIYEPNLAGACDPLICEWLNWKYQS